MFEKIKTISNNECTKENGYVLDVKKIIDIVDNYISNVNSEIIFIVNIEAEILKPEINKEFTDKVSMIFSGGIFIDIKNKMKVPNRR